MSPKTPLPMIATLFILGGTVFGVLGALHAVYTLLDLHNPRDDLSLSILRLHTRWRILCSDYREDARTCGELGLALTLATALASCWLRCWRSGLGSEPKMLPVGIIMPALTLIGCVYEVLALLYWFRIPASALQLVQAASPPLR